MMSKTHEDKKLNDEEIVKALECCNGVTCGDCPYKKKNISCLNGRKTNDSLDLIRRLQSENKKLEKRNGVLLCEKDAMEAQCIAIEKRVDELVEKEKPKKIQAIAPSLREKDRIAGYCPNCDGTVDIRLTVLVKLKGHRCSWCGQAIDISEEVNE